MIKELDTIDISAVLDAYQKMEHGIVWYESSEIQVNVKDTHLKRQTSLQYREGDDPWNSSVGKMRDKESLFCNINPYFKNSIFESLIDQYKLVRTRLLWVPPFSCYSIHRDLAQRIHIPIITNTECYFVFKKGTKGTIEHLPCGKVYQVNTIEQHTFMNCSSLPRLHFMGVVT